jgi:hypothetical protein
MSASNATDTTNPSFNSLARSTRSSRTIIDDVSVPLQGAPLLPGQTSPVNYMLAQRALAETVDTTHDTPGHAYMHARTAAILLRTFTPPAIGTTLPIYPEMPLIRCAAFSSVTDMQCYALDVNSTDGLVYSHFWQLSGAVWDCVSAANQDSLRALRNCLFSWSTEPTKPLPHVDAPTAAQSPSSAATSLTDQAPLPGTPILTPPLSSLNAPTFSIGLLATSTTNSPISVSPMLT